MYNMPPLPLFAGVAPSCRPDRPSTLPGGEPTGYLLSSSITDQGGPLGGGAGSLGCPWRLTVSPGQTVRLVLLSFGGARRLGEEGSAGGGADLAYGQSGASLPAEFGYEIGKTVLFIKLKLFLSRFLYFNVKVYIF